MKRLLAIVDAGDAGVTGVLAGEALRRAARDAGQPIEIELRTAQGVVNPVSAGNDDTLLFVGVEDSADAATRARAAAPGSRAALPHPATVPRSHRSR